MFFVQEGNMKEKVPETKLVKAVRASAARPAIFCGAFFHGL